MRRRRERTRFIPSLSELQWSAPPIPMWPSVRTAKVIALLVMGSGCSFALDVESLGAGCPEDATFEACSQPKAETGSECGDDEYEARALSEPGDRICLEITRCVPGQYQMAAPGDGVDRICAKCPSGTFSNTENASRCEKWSPCADGYAEHQAPTEKSDRVCSYCGADQFELDDQCSALSICEPGTYVAMAATPTSDRICEACPGETFSTEANSPSCQAWQTCPAGKIESDDPKEAPSSIQDRVCVSCGAEEFAQAGHCFPTTACQANEYETVAPSAVEDRECSLCFPDEVVEGERICSAVGHIQNYWARDWYLNIEDGVLGANYVDLSWDSTQWSLEPIDGYYRIRHRYERNQYVHTEGGELQVGPISRTWWSAQWRLIDVSFQFPTDGGRRVYWIQNKNAPEVYLHVQNGVLEAGPTDSRWHSAVWFLPPL